VCAVLSGSVGDVKIQSGQFFGRERHADVLAVVVRDAKAEIVALLTPPCAQAASINRGEVPAIAGDFVEGRVIHAKRYHGARFATTNAAETETAATVVR
jgi:hypothetical protein